MYRPEELSIYSNKNSANNIFSSQSSNSQKSIKSQSFDENGVGKGDLENPYVREKRKL